MVEKSASVVREKPTKLFITYTIQLVLRATIFLVALYLLIFNPEALSLNTDVNLTHGFSFVDFVFIVLVVDILTKFFPTARLAMGSLKQYARFHVPTVDLIERARNGENLLLYIREIIIQGRIAIEQVPAKLHAAWQETRTGAIDSLKVLIKSFSIRKLIPLTDEQLKASDTLRAQIRRDRFREIVPVIIFWIIFNAIIAVAFIVLGVFNQQTMLIWTLFYFLFDMICVVLWCPLQLVFMKNRCCTTCQIFNWDAIMTATPLILICWQLSAAWFTWPVILLSVVVLIRWEAAFARFPERFDERTNASLSCANCKDKLCYLREPLSTHLPDMPEQIDIKKS